MESEKNLSELNFIQREYSIEHPTYDTELRFYDAVSSGNIDYLNTHYNSQDVNDITRGILSDNPLQNLKYHVVITIAMITRFCIEKGMNEKECYNLSDYYVKKTDICKNEESVRNIHRQASFDFATRMNKLNSKSQISLHCIKALDYINNHLHETIKTSHLANKLGLERTYFSKLFTKELGITPSQYIKIKKLEAAKNMLIYTEHTINEISQYYSFSDCSHFSYQFKNHYGISPNDYRNLYYRKSFTK